MIRTLTLAIALLAAAGHALAAESLREVIDRQIKAGWDKEKIATPGLASDEVFLRRVYLDLVGVIPSYEEAGAFLDDAGADKRQKLIDKLLSDPRYARQQAQVWDVALLGRFPKGVSQKQREGFRQWLSERFAANDPYDRIVARLLTAEEDGTALFYVATGGTNDTTTAVARLFLGKQIQCAQCHDHPYEPLTQKDYFGMVGFFVRTSVVETEPAPNVKKHVVAEKSTGEVTFADPAKAAKPGEKKSGGKKEGDPLKPRFLSGAELVEPELPKDFVEPKVKPKEAPPKPVFSRRAKVVEWITAKENPYFARAAVNRIWAQLMGRGFVHPVDDFTEKGDVSHPQLLDALTAAFVEHGCDVKWLIREIVSSNAYQVTDLGANTEPLLPHYERARVRPLGAEELLSSLAMATGTDEVAAGKSMSMETYLKYFGEPTDGRGAFQSTLAEHLYFHNGDLHRGLCRPNKNNLAQMLLSGAEPVEAKVDRMFLSTLSRRPTDAERQRFAQYLSVEVKNPKDANQAKAPAQRIEEALWVLVSCSEFRFNR